MGLLGLYFFIAFVIYRTPNFKPVKCFEGEVVFKSVDINLNLRDFFEKNILGNESMVIASEEVGFYINKHDRLKLWEMKPQDLMKQACGLKVRINAQPLLFGGYSLSVIDEIVKIETTIKMTK